mgnify:CR=1 FL=1
MRQEKEFREKATLSRQEIANRLHFIASAFERGSMTAGQMQVSMPNQALYEFEIEPNEIELEIIWR